MDISTILTFLKGINLKYEKSEDGKQSLDMNIKNDPTDLRGSLSVKFGDQRQTISANIGHKEK
jgi:hypothetical protein